MFGMPIVSCKKTTHNAVKEMNGKHRDQKGGKRNITVQQAKAGEVSEEYLKIHERFSFLTEVLLYLDEDVR